jgi:hypothetical protein
MRDILLFFLKRLLCALVSSWLIFPFGPAVIRVLHSLGSGWVTFDCGYSLRLGFAPTRYPRGGTDLMTGARSSTDKLKHIGHTRKLIGHSATNCRQDREL